MPSKENQAEQALAVCWGCGVWGRAAARPGRHCGAACVLGPCVVCRGVGVCVCCVGPCAQILPGASFSPQGEPHNSKHSIPKVCLACKMLAF